MRRDSGPLNCSATFLFGWASLGAVASGCYAMVAAQTGSAFWLRNLLAWLAGGLLALAMSRVRLSAAVVGAMITVILVALGGTLLGAGEMGVHRWIDAGPLHINVAGLVLPLLLVALGAAPQKWGSRFSVALAVVLVLYLQPDASQASAFALGVLLLLGIGRLGSVTDRSQLALIITLATAAWLRRDPLPSVPEVEGIIGVAWRLSPLIALSALTCLAVAVASPLLLVRSGAATRVALALSSYFAMSSLAPWCGTFPVPLVGAGMSSIVGFWLGIGSLAALERSLAASPTRVPPANPTHEAVERSEVGSEIDEMIRPVEAGAAALWW